MDVSPSLWGAIHGAVSCYEVGIVGIHIPTLQALQAQFVFLLPEHGIIHFTLFFLIEKNGDGG